jgi:hypothetical protein
MISTVPRAGTKKYDRACLQKINRNRDTRETCGGRNWGGCRNGYIDSIGISSIIHQKEENMGENKGL